MFRSEKTVWIVVFAVEAVFVLLTRIVVAYYPIKSLEAEVIRTALRLAVVLIYWVFLRDFFRSQISKTAGIFHGTFLLSIALFMSVPLLVGHHNYPTLTTRVVFSVTSIVVGIREEIAFRGIIQNLLAKQFGNLIAILLASVLFTAFHIGVIFPSLYNYGDLFIVSLIFGIVYAQTQSLWLVAWLHTLYDVLWTLTPVLFPPFPYSIGLAVLLVALWLIGWWGRFTIWPNKMPQKRGRF